MDETTIRHGSPSNDDRALPRVGEAAIRGGVGARNLERARLYLAWGAVFDARRVGMSLRARCEGSTEERYRVEVRFDAREIVAASCSCPVGEAGGCKHTAAVLLHWREDPDDFVALEPLDRRLAALGGGELLAVMRALLRERPELEAPVEALLPKRPDPRRAPTPDVWRARAAAIFRARGDDAGAAAEDLAALVREGVAGAPDVGARAAVHRQVAAAALGRWRRLGDGCAPVVAVARCAVEALADCATAATDPEARGVILRSLVDLYRFDVEQGTVGSHGPGLGRRAVSLAVARATPAERHGLAERVRDEMERADDWGRRAWAFVRVDIEEGLVDDDAWFSLCRTWQRFGAMARRLASLGRRDEALAEAARVPDAELVEVADALAGRGLPVEAERLVSSRVPRASEAQRARMTAWLKGRAEARRDALAALDAAEGEFRARPELAGYDALREAAMAAGVRADFEARAHAFLLERAHPLLFEVLLRDGRLDEAWRAATSEHVRPTQAIPARVRVAEALEAGRPRDAMDLYRRCVDGLVALRSRPQYREACRLAARVVELHERLGDPAAGDAWLASLRARYATLPAFQRELAVRFDDQTQAA